MRKVKVSGKSKSFSDKYNLKEVIMTIKAKIPKELLTEVVKLVRLGLFKSEDEVIKRNAGGMAENEKIKVFVEKPGLTVNP